MIFDFRRCFYQTDKWQLEGWYYDYRTKEDLKLDIKSGYVKLTLYLPNDQVIFKFWDKDGEKVLDTMSKVVRSEDKIFCWNRDFEDIHEDFSQNIYVNGSVNTY